MKHLPNLLSASRIVLGLGLIIPCVTGHWAIAWWLFVAAALSDFVDGPLARRLDAVSPLGDRLDKYGDAVLLIGAYAGLLIGGKFPLLSLLIVAISLRIAFSSLRKSASQISEEMAKLGAAAVVIIVMVLGLELAIAAYGQHRWYGAVGLAAMAFIAITRRHRFPMLWLPRHRQEP